MNAISLKPTVKVAIKKSILRVYEVDNTSTVYLKDGSEFEIELFNPLQEIILCKFKLNGKSLNGEGLILYPGQRVFLERYLDDNKKFKFETYKVEDTPEVNGAIIKNGLLEVEFFKEALPIQWVDLHVRSMPYTAPPVYLGNMYNCGTITTPNLFNTTTNTVNFCTSGTTFNNPLNTTLTSTASSENFSLTSSNPLTNKVKKDKRSFSKSIEPIFDIEMDCSPEPKEKETGRIGKGEKSDQRFTYLNMDFQAYAFLITRIKILPESEKIYDDKDLKHRKYCSECGKKINHKDKYCSDCGAKL